MKIDHYVIITCLKTEPTYKPISITPDSSLMISIVPGKGLITLVELLNMPRDLIPCLVKLILKGIHQLFSVSREYFAI